MVPQRARRLAPFSLALSLVGSTAIAFAAEPARVVFVGAEGCPSDTDLVVAVAARGRAIVSVPSAGEDALRISLRKEGAGYRGIVRSGTPPHASERELAGASCREVVDAVAIVVAGALAPVSPSPSPSPSPPSVPASAPRPVASSTPVVPDSPNGARGPSEPPVVSAAPEQEREVREAPNSLDIPPNEPAKLKQYRDLTIFAGAMTGPLPGTIVPRVDFEVRRSALLDVAKRTSFVVGPILRMRVGYFGGGSLKNEAGSASVSGVSVGLSPCTDLRYRRLGLSALLCPEFAAGLARSEITARGSQSTFPTTRGFSTFGVDAELSYALGPHVHLAVKAGLDGQLGRLTGERPDGRLVFRSPLVSGHSLVGVGTSF